LNLLRYLLAIPIELPSIAVISLVYLLFDIYPSVKSFSAMLKTPSFCLLWVYFAVSTTVAYGFLSINAFAKVQNLVGTELTKLTMIILAALMAATIFQSLSLKISDVKIVNLQSLIDNYRAQVLADILKKSAEYESKKVMNLGDQLAKRFGGDLDTLRTEYTQLLVYGGQTLKLAGEELTKLEAEANGLKLSVPTLLAARIARIDRARAETLLNR